MGGLNV